MHYCVVLEDKHTQTLSQRARSFYRVFA